MLTLKSINNEIKAFKKLIFSAINNIFQLKLIFLSIPHQRILSGSTSNKEIFDLYRLGTFEVIKESGEVSIENIELVELQPNASYQPHLHRNSKAHIFIIHGVGDFLLGNSRIKYAPNKHIFIPQAIEHGFITQTKTLFLSIQSPPIIDPHSGVIDIHYMEII